jgi:AcrR family transcriptional regulator
MGKPDKKQQILKAAVTLFGRSHDARKVSIEEIAAEAHVSPTTIYNYFGTRETLVLETAKALMRDIIKMSMDVLHSDLPFPEKLKAIISGKMDLVGQYSKEVLGKLLGNDKSSAAFGRELFETEVKPLWLDFIASGKKEGYIDPAVDDEALLAYLDILRKGASARPDLTADYQKNMPLLKGISRLIFFGFINKEIAMFPGEVE